MGVLLCAGYKFVNKNVHVSQSKALTPCSTDIPRGENTFTLFRC